MGLFRIKGESVKIHYPEEKSNYFQRKSDNKTFEEDPHLLSDHAQYFYKNFTEFNLSTEFFPVSTENLNNGESHKILKLKYELEKEKYESEADSFWQTQKEKNYNRMISDFQKVINKKNDYPESEISGMEFGKYDPILNHKIETIYKKNNLE